MLRPVALAVSCALVAAALVGTGIADAPAASGAATSSAAEHAADAYVWGYPLVVTERTLQSLAQRAPVNHLTFQPARSDVTTRTIVAPNTDTLYGVAPLDLRAAPYLLTLPAIRDRYYSFQLISAYTDSFAYIGTRATGGRAGTWAITPPGWHGRLPHGVTRIASPTPQLLLLGRFLVVDDADVARVHALTARMRLAPLAAATGATAETPPPIGAPRGTAQSVAAAGAGFFDELGDALAINPPVDAYERRVLRTYSDLGIGPGRHPTTEGGTAQTRAVLAAGVRIGQRRINAALARPAHTVNGWATNLHLGTYGHDAGLRAVVAASGWGANVPQEAVYAHLGDATRTPYQGTQQYVLHFARDDLPPVKAFWSVTMYGPDRFFVANPIDRYAIGDRTQGLHYGKDGSLDVFVQHDPPAGHESNWLPAPSGAFYLSMRLYLPKAKVLAGHYRFPKLTVRRGA